MNTCFRSSLMSGLALFLVCSQGGVSAAEAGAKAQAVTPAGDLPSLRPARLPDQSVFVPKLAQYRLGLRSARVSPASEGSEFRLEALVVPDPAHSARIGSAERGLFEVASPQYLQLGAKVSKGAVLGYIRPLLGAAEEIRRRADIKQTEQELIINEQGLKQLGLQLQGQPGMSSTTIYRENLMTDRDRLKVKLREDRLSLAGRIPLVAPVSGEISEVRVQNGSLAEAGVTLFEIIDPNRIWVEARSYESLDPASIDGAVARTRENHSIPLKFVGQGSSADQQFRALEFAVTGSAQRLRIGERVSLGLGQVQQDGTVLPQASLTQGSAGQHRVWVQTAAERFERREVEASVLPGGRALIRAGLENGERVVTEGGWLLEQVR